MPLFLLFIILDIFANSATYVGDGACKKCHIQEHTQWQGSYHDMAMKKATQQSVVGDFNNSTFSLYGVTTTFYKKK